MILQALRSLLFYAVFYVQVAVLAIAVAVIALVNGGRWSPAGWAIARFWVASNKVLLLALCGIRTRVEGAKNIPEGGCIVAAKHQSDWDIYAILPHIGRPAFIAKKELLAIPFFGRAARSMGTISVDRGRGSAAIPAMTEDARAALADGRRLVIFPEGTRRAPLAPADYRFGVARLYAALDVPVVPVALDSGLYWGRNSLVLWPGTARARFLPPIAPGLDPSTFHQKLIETIETETDRMILEAVDGGLGRPLDPRFRQRIDDARARVAAR